jgi:Uma2 family endonuclease
MNMSTKTAISIEEYLRTSFEDLDREFVDGEVVERSLPDRLHSRTQFRLAGLLFKAGEAHPLYGQTEMRSRVAATRVRIPDVSVYAGEEPTERVPTQPPLVAIEILSPDDRHLAVMQKLEEYRAWGVRHIWLVDPERRRLQVYGSGSLSEVPALEIPEYDVRLTAADIFR